MVAIENMWPTNDGEHHIPLSALPIVTMTCAVLSCKPPAFGEFDAFCKTAHTRVNGVAILLEFFAHIPKICQRDGEGFDELVFLKPGLRILVLRKRQVDGHVYHSQVRVAETRIFEESVNEEVVGRRRSTVVGNKDTPKTR